METPACPAITREQKQLLSELSAQSIEALPELVIQDSLITVFDQDELERTGIEIYKPDPEGFGIGTINDPRMGVTDMYQACASCSQNNFNCPGHLGFIRLAVPVYHPLFIRIIFHVLKSVCNECGGLLMDEDTLRSKGLLQLSGYDRLRAIAEASAGRPCRLSYTCHPNPIFLVNRFPETGKIMVLDAASGRERELPIETVSKILSSISDQDAQTLGFQNGAHPRNLILRNLPVIPPCDRPHIEIEDRGVNQDPITKHYLTILRENQRLKQPDLSENARAQLVRSLTHAIQELIGKTDGSYATPDKSSKNTISIKQRIQGKEALIRGAMMGKRVNYFGRTVLSADPSLKYGQIALPLEWRSILTRPEVVTPYNQRYLQGLLRSGQVNFITAVRFRSRGKIPVTPAIRSRYLLEIGDVVDRWLQPGDYVLFGRHPTLHKQSMMGYEVVFKPQRSIGFNPSFAAPHNLDFDGDEGNVHVPQTLDAAIELREIVSAKHCIMSSQSNRPVVGISYDALSGAYMLTQESTEIPELLFLDMLHKLTNREAIPTLEERMNQLGVAYKRTKAVRKFRVQSPILAISKIPDPQAWRREHPELAALADEELFARYTRNFFVEREVEVPEVVYTGRAAFSALLPPDFTYQHSGVLIVRGVLVSGAITKDHIGDVPNSIVQAIWKDYGPARAVDFLTDAPFLVNRWLESVSLSVSLRDCTLRDPDSEIKIQSEYQAIKMKIDALAREQVVNPVERARQERQIVAQLHDFKTSVVKIVQSALQPGNSFTVMATSKSKGNEAYIAQILGALGQQFLQNQRIPLAISRGTRCLAYFAPGDLDPAARGFCISSFVKGLSPAELFFHQTASREGLLDTAVKVSDTGSMFHRIVKNLENLVVSEDRSVRIVDGPIVQFVYGNDAFNPEHLEHVVVGGKKFLSFIDVQRVAARLNAELGFLPAIQAPAPEAPPPPLSETYEYEHEYEEEEEFE